MDRGKSYAEELDYEEDHSSFISRITSALLTPLSAVVSKNAVTAYLGTFLFFVTAICMIFVSVFAYGLFYYNVIPHVGLERVVHLQFGEAHPWGIATLDSSLVSFQPYDVHVELELPQTPSNLAAGNFMLDLSLLSQPSTSASTGENSSPQIISHSRRPAILSYASPLIDISRKVTFMPLYILGWQREAERLVVRMMERVEFTRGALNIPGSARLELHSQVEMQVYAAKVIFRAHLTGLRWIMYRWRITSFFVFTSMFWSVSMFSFSLSWIILPCFFASSRTKKQKGEVKAEDEREGPRTIKQEPVEQLGFQEAEPSAEPSIRGSNIKQEADTEEEDEPDSDELLHDPGLLHSSGTSGSGTGIENDEAAGLQQRRGHLFES
ncbi:putative adipose-regulatory protein-domain-containing protein [Aspergillus pseudodeflectus]|uniref:Adipose-regulatory protein-domain-containing protein n=1 Tax=Aspergillus pseudodeflectus TaxID=176178 RepID=A0ABR4L745_9EURO